MKRGKNQFYFFNDYIRAVMCLVDPRHCWPHFLNTQTEYDFLDAV